MIDGMDFERESFGQPLRKLRIVGLHLARHDAHRGPTVDLLQPVQNRPQKRLVFGRFAHVVDRQDDDALDAFFTNPLWRDELRKVPMRIPWVVFVEIGQAITVANSGVRGG